MPKNIRLDKFEAPKDERIQLKHQWKPNEIIPKQCVSIWMCCVSDTRPAFMHTFHFCYWTGSFWSVGAYVSLGEILYRDSLRPVETFFSLNWIQISSLTQKIIQNKLFEVIIKVSVWLFHMKFRPKTQFTSWNSLSNSRNFLSKLSHLISAFQRLWNLFELLISQFLYFYIFNVK